MSESISTTCVQGGYRPGDGEPRQIPIYQSTTWKYDTSEHMGRLFDLEEAGYFYTRLANPTNDFVAAKIAELEGGTAAMLTSSGQAANFFAVFNIAGAGDHVVASSAIYGGTYNLLAVTMKRMGLECTFVSPDCTDEELEAFENLFGRIALIEWVDGKLLSTASSIAGCGPAFAAMFLESLGDAGVKHGLPRATAYRLAAQMMMGTAKLHLETGTHPGAMKDAVCSPGGTTIKGVAALEKDGFRGCVIDAIDAIEGE